MTNENNAQYFPIIFGKLDQNIRQVENAFNVVINERNGEITINGQNEAPARKVIEKLLVLARQKEVIDENSINYIIEAVKEGQLADLEHDKSIITLTAANKPIKPKTAGQSAYVEKMQANVISFGIGPAGTGKTYLAMSMAIAAFRKNEVSRIILTRPAIEAGEKLGFLPGDLAAKIDPYLRPLYDALFEIMGQESFNKNLEKGTIEVAPLAYMRGRTLDNSFIVLDEAQNTTPEQMKMFLTRIGFGAKAVITGDITQIDLPKGQKSGLIDALEVLGNDIAGIGIHHLSARDIVRHPLVQKIIKAYEKREARLAYKEKKLPNR